MRKSEITPELIELSKKAKELGFPQDVEEGDWYCVQVKNRKILHLATNEDPYIEDFHDAWKLLSFSRCLEWLREQRYDFLDTLFEPDENYNLPWVLWAGIIKEKHKGSRGYVTNEVDSRGKTHHEAIAKAVVKILEGGSG